MTRIACIVCGIAAFAISGCGGDGGSKSNGQPGGGGGGGGSPGVYADRAVTYAPVISPSADALTWPYFFAPSTTLGPPGGFLDVASLGYDPAATSALGGSIVLGLGNSGGPRCIVDGAGDDLAIYENAFRTTDSLGNPGTNNELAVVEVSADNSHWYEVPHSAGVGNLIDPANYSGFAGVIPENEGGDRFDLADVIAAHIGLTATFQACYVRLTDGGTAYPDYGNTQTDLYASGADIDAIEALNSVPAPGLSP